MGGSKHFCVKIVKGNGSLVWRHNVEGKLKDKDRSKDFKTERKTK